MGKLLILIVLAVMFFIGGTRPEMAEFFKSGNPVAVSQPKTTIDPSPIPKPLTEPLNAPVMPPTEVAPVVKDINVPHSTPVAPVNNEAITWNRLIAEGFSREQTAGIMGNLKQEHNFNTDGDGLAQWTQDRYNKLMAKANNQDIHVQLDYLMEELNGNYAHVKETILASGLEGSMLTFQNKFEKCGDCREATRFNYAYEILGKY